MIALVVTSDSTIVGIEDNNINIIMLIQSCCSYHEYDGDDDDDDGDDGDNSYDSVDDEDDDNDDDDDSVEPGKTSLRSSILILLVIPEMNNVVLLLINDDIVYMSTDTTTIIQYITMNPSLRAMLLVTGLVASLLLTLALNEVILILCKPGALLLIA